MKIQVETFTPAEATALVAANDLGGSCDRQLVEIHKEQIAQTPEQLFMVDAAGRRGIQDPLIIRPDGSVCFGIERIVALSELADADLAVHFWVLRDFVADGELTRFFDDARAGRLASGAGELAPRSADSR